MTYDENHSCDKFYCDVEEMALSVSIPAIDLLIFGFPCQSFSIAGKRKGFDDSRGRTVLAALKILAKKRPKFFIAENVVGIVSIKNRKIFDNIIKRMFACGYKVYHNILDSKNFGVPQQRRRLWFVGIRNDLDDNFSFPTGFGRHVGLSEVLEKKVDKFYYAKSEFLKKEKVKNRLKNYENDFITCLTNCMVRNGSSSEYINYVAAVYKAIGQKRKPTPRECARLQGFNESFKFPKSVSISQRYKQMANTMTVGVLKEIFKNLL